jgi:hypothetical protein
VQIDGVKKKYSSILKWFKFEGTFETPLPKNIKFECIICVKLYLGALGKPGNIYKHLKTQPDGIVVMIISKKKLN